MHDRVSASHPFNGFNTEIGGRKSVASASRLQIGNRRPATHCQIPSAKLIPASPAKIDDTQIISSEHRSNLGHNQVSFRACASIAHIPAVKISLLLRVLSQKIRNGTLTVEVCVLHPLS